jgi:hypothetical protein
MISGSNIATGRDLFAPTCKPVQVEPKRWHCPCCGVAWIEVRPREYEREREPVERRKE